MKTAPTAVAPIPPSSSPWWKTGWKAAVVIVLVAVGFFVIRPRGDFARNRAYSIMKRPGVNLSLIDGKLEYAKFDLAPGIGENGNLGWAFHQLVRFPEVKSVETMWLLPVNIPTLNALPELETLVVHRAEIEDDDLAVFSGMRELKELNLGGEKITPRCLEHLVGLAKLKSLKISGAKMFGGGFESISRIPNLESLSIEGGRGEWKEPLSFGPANKLKSLRLANLDLAGDGTKDMDQLQALEELRLWNVRIDAAFLRAMSRIPRLKAVKIQSSDGSFEEYAEILAEFPSLTTLYVADQSNSEDKRWITKRVMEKLSRSKTIEELGVYHGRVGDDGLRFIAMIPKLRILKLIDVGLTEESIPVFVGIKSLEELVLYDARLTPRTRLQFQPNAELKAQLEKRNVKLSFNFGWGAFW